MKERERWKKSFQQASDEVSEWREKHPRASLTAIEQAVDGKLAKVRREMIEELAMESQLRDMKGLAVEERPRCPGCGQPMVANGQQKRQLKTTYEEVIELERSKGYCRHCGVSFFPPG
jgi:hypothetical protein